MLTAKGMVELDKREMIIRYSTIGLVLGFAVLLSIYALLFQSIEEPFSFHGLRQPASKTLVPLYL